MSTFTDQRDYDLAQVIFNTTDGAETVKYQTAEMPVGVSVASLWGATEVADLGQGFVADANRVHIRVAALSQFGTALVPERGATLTRYSTNADPRTHERWEVERVRRFVPGIWELDVLKAESIRPGV